MQFKGWAQTSIQLSFDQPAQTLYGRVNVEGVNLEGVAPIANNFVTVFVRNAIDSRVNPLELVRPSQLQLLIPVKGSNGSIKAHVKDVSARRRRMESCVCTLLMTSAAQRENSREGEKPLKLFNGTAGGSPAASAVRRE